MDELKIIKAGEVTTKEVEWLWYPFIPYGKLTVIQGDARDGKSTFILKLAAMLSKGEPMPFTDGDGQEPINIIYQSSEDDAEDTIVPRYLKAGGDPESCSLLTRANGSCPSPTHGFWKPQSGRKRGSLSLILCPHTSVQTPELTAQTKFEIKCGR